MTDSMTYLYAVTRCPVPGGTPRLTGIGGSPVRTVDSGGLTALVSSVDVAEFGAQALRENLEDLRWLEKTVRAHNDVINAVAAGAPVAPLGLATVYYGDDRVRQVLVERAETFSQVLDHITGRTEWGVKAYAEPTVPAQSTTATTPDSAERPGAAYLKRLRARQHHQEQAKRDHLRVAEGIHTRLDDLAEASRVHPPQNRELAGYRGLMVLNGAYLVEDSRNDEFQAAARELAERHGGLRLEVTGPWPAYSFAAVGDGVRS